MVLRPYGSVRACKHARVPLTRVSRLPALASHPQVFRQSDDEFVRLLDDIRYGRNVPAALQRLVACCSRPIV